MYTLYIVCDLIASDFKNIFRGRIKKTGNCKQFPAKGQLMGFPAPRGVTC
jgi:hypothetical protein